ncbi:MAG: ABC transporter ATP-binding protein, partial [Planctomycetales bacterium]
MAEVTVNNLTKVFPPAVTAVDAVSFSVAAGEMLVVVGPSGCGKTTLLRMIAGFEHPSSGTIEIAGNDVRNVEPHKRGVAMAMQRAALYPTKNVHGNIDFGLKMRKADRDGREHRVLEVAELLGLVDLLDRQPGELSGGQQRRVSLARALAVAAPCLLLDEPLSHLDADSRRQLRDDISGIHKQLGTTTIYVTHDQEEAMAVGDRLAVMSEGRLQQCDAPQVIYDQPANRFVAEIISASPVNYVPCQIKTEGNGLFFECDLGRLELP